MNNSQLWEKLKDYKNPLVLTFIGVALALTVYLKDIKLIWLLCGFLILLLICFIVNRLKIEIIILFASFILSLFYINFYFANFTYTLNDSLGKNCIFVGQLVSQSDDISDFSKQYLFKIQKIIVKNQSEGYKEILVKKKCIVQVLGSSYEEYSKSEMVQLSGILKKPKSALLPGLFDERKYLMAKGIFYILKAETGSLVFLDRNPNLFLSFVSFVREKVVRLNSKSLKGDSLSLVNGIILGAKASKINHELKEKIQTLGLSHITSASGFNVSILTFSIFYLTKYLIKGNLFPSVFSIFAVFFYAAIADFSSSIVRAAAFILLILMGNLCKLKLKILPATSLILIVFFLFLPVSLTDLGLQLSVIAYLSLMLFFSELEFKQLNFPNNFFVSIFLQTLIAQIFVMPLIAFYFQNVQILGLVSNLVAVPISSFILQLGLLIALFEMIPLGDLLSKLFFPLINSLSNVFLLWVDFLYNIQLPKIFVPNFSFSVLIFVYLLLFYSVAFLFIDFYKKIYYFFLIIILGFAVFFFNYSDHRLKIFCIPVYNKDITLVIESSSNPVLFGYKFKDKDVYWINNFLKSNNISNHLFVCDLSKKNCNINSKFVKNYDDRVEILYKNFSFTLLKNFQSKVKYKTKFLKLPILKKEVMLEEMFLTYPENLIINDYKRLSKKSVKDISLIKKMPTMSFFLSETGQLAISTNGNKYDISALNNFRGLND